ncbi:MAG TPA: YkgJ family cysteine cluster protein, partial [Candidatus Blautia faecavium]|nr:YkgJ family cysteine cluster protein [Candidatus Blautia faecavium]
IKVKKWIDTPDVKRYEAFVRDWHYFLKDVQEVLYQTEDTDKIRDLNLYVVKKFYMLPYDQERDFYPQFYERLAEGKEILKEEKAIL